MLKDLMSPRDWDDIHDENGEVIKQPPCEWDPKAVPCGLIGGCWIYLSYSDYSAPFSTVLTQRADYVTIDGYVVKSLKPGDRTFVPTYQEVRAALYGSR